jgi:hypothetical protein
VATDDDSSGSDYILGDGVLDRAGDEMKDRQRIRSERTDLTDYVVHLTKESISKVDGRLLIRNGRQVLKQILEDGHLKATFAPLRTRYPMDFTWEREWRVVPRNRWNPTNNLPIALDTTVYGGVADGAIIVPKDEDVAVIRRKVEVCRARGDKWTKRLRKIISLETAEAKMESDERYCRIDTWPAEE